MGFCIEVGSRGRQSGCSSRFVLLVRKQSVYVQFVLLGRSAVALTVGTQHLICTRGDRR